ncbi:uncharacterized protein [Neodiprion pinetum]|uniref:Uncharacterized protein LOC107225730 n=1 Tax=Neodiprion lecontei TaxID=441921 RepID=A0A6J0C5Y3_NEOLC|nr:uncharacterized protein LOC107225730 [Neodiprion lecontei]XP_046468858.1 uncharacterized protein LOC124212637 [Neodiprion pinetum]
MSAIVREEATTPTTHRGLSDWWNEETEYVFQRIEEWAALARGYNRLKSQRYSRGHLTMKEEPGDTNWSISANKLVVGDCESWNPRFYRLERSWRRKSRPEEVRINCCGSLNYQSNNRVDSQCLEAYRYDHSIYFKTIGDIRGRNRNRNSSLKRAESPKIAGEIECHRCDDELSGKSPLHDEDQPSKAAGTQVWPITDLTQMNLEADESRRYLDDELEGNLQNDNYCSSEDNLNNNNQANNSVQFTGNSITRKTDQPLSLKQRLVSIRRTRQSPRKVSQPTIVGDNNVVWPGVLLNYKKKGEAVCSPHRHSIKK